MPKSGQARVLTAEQKAYLFDVIKQHRHPEKNRAIMQISFKLGLRAQEIALLEIKEIADLIPGNTAPRTFRIKEIMALPASYTKGANVSKKDYQRRSITIPVHEFDRIVRDVARLATAGVDVKPSDYYPPIKSHRGVSRDLPMIDDDLRISLSEYLQLRLDSAPWAKPSDPLFIAQKGSPYSPGSLQKHMGKMLKQWAGIEKASSHSGRRTLATNIIHIQKDSVKTAQKVLGHKNAATTLIYEEPTETQIVDALSRLNKT